MGQAASFGATVTLCIQTFSSSAIKKTLLSGKTPLNLTAVCQNCKPFIDEAALGTNF